jgi:hypothetical protein
MRLPTPAASRGFAESDADFLAHLTADRQRAGDLAAQHLARRVPAAEEVIEKGILEPRIAAVPLSGRGCS